MKYFLICLILLGGCASAPPRKVNVLTPSEKILKEIVPGRVLAKKIPFYIRVDGDQELNLPAASE